MIEGAVSVYPRILAAEGVTNLDVGGKVAALTGARAVPHLDAARDSLDGNLATLAAVGPGIDGHVGDRLLAAGRIVRPVAARVSGPVVERLGPLVLERRQVAGSFRHAGCDDPIRKRVRRGIVVDGDGLADGIFPSRQERRNCDREVDCGSQSHAAGRTGRPGHGGLPRSGQFRLSEFVVSVARRRGGPGVGAGAVAFAPGLRVRPGHSPRTSEMKRPHVILMAARSRSTRHRPCKDVWICQGSPDRLGDEGGGSCFAGLLWHPTARQRQPFMASKPKREPHTCAVKGRLTLKESCLTGGHCR